MRGIHEQIKDVNFQLQHALQQAFLPPVAVEQEREKREKQEEEEARIHELARTRAHYLLQAELARAHTLFYDAALRQLEQQGASVHVAGEGRADTLHAGIRGHGHDPLGRGDIQSFQG